MKIAVVGTGYVGLVAGACFADSGNEVTCIDHDPAKIQKLKQGLIPIYEPGLQEIVRRGTSEGRLRFTTSIEEGARDAEVVFLAVGTPALPSGQPDLQYLQTAAQQLGQVIAAGTVVVNKSTVPIGAHLKVKEWIASQTRNAFSVVSNPEFLKEGSAVEDFLKPDRVVIGTDDETTFKKMEKLYAPFVRQGNPIFRMDPISAEMTKYACNSFLATRISFMNDLSRLCDLVGADIEKVRTGMASDVRIGKHFLYAGVGYGGSCFPKDIQALAATARERGTVLKIVEATEAVNLEQKTYMVQKAQKVFGASLKGKSFAVWGLAFKPNTDDLREAPALTLIDALLNLGAQIQVFDPVAMPGARALLGEKVKFCKTALEAAQGTDAVFLTTEWNEFRQISFEKLGQVMKARVLFDGRNIWDPETVKEKGFSYFAVGRGPAETKQSSL